MDKENPWISRQVPAPLEETPARTSMQWVPSTPQDGVEPPAAKDLLPIADVARSATLWFMGAHGGSGETAMSSLVAGSAPAQHSWPIHPEGSRVVVVARSNAAGLRAAQRAAQQWAAGLLPGVNLLGLVVVADAAGRLPRILRDQVKIVSGGYAQSWFIPWVEAWRFAESTAPEPIPRAVLRIVDELTQLQHQRKEPGNHAR